MRRHLLTCLAMGVLMAPASAQAADTKIAEPTSAQEVAGHAGRLAWSEGDRLMTWFNGLASQVPVPAQEGGFDVDLGRGPGGGTVAVYSRPDGLYLFDFTAGAERRLDRLSKPKVRERGPVIDRGRVAFLSGTAQRRGLYVGSIGSGEIRRVPKVPASIGGYDFQGRRVVYTQVAASGDRSTDRLFVHDIRTGGRRVLARVTSGALSAAWLAGPTIAGRFAYVAKVRLFAAGNRFLRIGLRTRRTREVAGRRHVIQAAFTGGRALYLSTRSDEADQCGPCTLALTPRLF